MVLRGLSLFILTSVVLPEQAAAQINLERFRPAVDSRGLLTVDRAAVLGHLDPSFGLVLSYAWQPLSLRGPIGSCPATVCQGQPLDGVYRVDHQITANLQAALGLFRRFEVGLALPLSAYSGGVSPLTKPDTAGKVSAQGAGDLVFFAKGRVLDLSRYPIGLAVLLELILPTGSAGDFLKSGQIGLRPTIIVNRAFFGKRLALALNLGAHFRMGEARNWTDDRQCNFAGQTFACGSKKTLRGGHRLIYRTGASLDILEERLQFLLELVGQAPAPVAHEVLLGLKLRLAQSSHLTLAVGRGLRKASDNFAYGTPGFRGVLGFSFEPTVGDRDHDGLLDDVDRCPNDSEDFDEFEDDDGCPDPDNDRDQILDRDDGCPDEPEDRDGFEDSDGCPEQQKFDRDGDGIADHLDRCPDDPEDRDGFEDADGCPDVDNDQDSVLDIDDLCPNAAEDRDRFDDDDGCPDPDNDQDRILDCDDRCPNVKENYNRYQDEDGCPDKAPATIKQGKVVDFGKIYFETDKARILPESYPALENVVWVLKDNPSLKLIEVQGHADERGSARYNLSLTAKRAAAVQRYLIAKGVLARRLRSKGYGESDPVDRGHDQEAWSKNRRVEFVILKRSMH